MNQVTIGIDFVGPVTTNKFGTAWIDVNFVKEACYILKSYKCRLILLVQVKNEQEAHHFQLTISRSALVAYLDKIYMFHKEQTKKYICQQEQVHFLVDDSLDVLNHVTASSSTTDPNTITRCCWFGGKDSTQAFSDPQGSIVACSEWKSTLRWIHSQSDNAGTVSKLTTSLSTLSLVDLDTIQVLDPSCLPQKRKNEFIW